MPITTEVIQKQLQELDHVVERLRAGALAIIPTDNVYGFVANGDRPEVVDRIYELKARDRSKPLCYFTTKLKASTWGEIDARAEAIMNLWPAPISFIVPKKPVVPDYVTSGMDSVLLVCIDAFTSALVEKADFPIVATSANTSGQPAITNFDEAYAQFDGQVDMVLQGEPSKRGMSSTIVNLTYDPPIIQRIGPIGLDQVREFIPNVIIGEI